MFLCYVDESGTPDIPGNTSHFILAGIAIPVSCWRDCDADVARIKQRYGLQAAEVHVGWMARSYREQETIPGFAAMDHARRRAMVTGARAAELLRLKKVQNPSLYKQVKKNYKQTDAYIHLTRAERTAVLHELAACVAGWDQARLFADCIDKAHFAARGWSKTLDEEAFEQIVSRFERYLQNIGGETPQRFGLLIHDNNQTVARRHTDIMKRFHRAGTLWTGIKSLIETPLYVDSQLTSMIQIADLCGYIRRRYVENNETDLFDLVFQRADRVGPTVVGVRHFTKLTCSCRICAAHRRSAGTTF
ncbi:MAG: DUF3800 domain-containing protein [bacterium]